MRPGQRPWHNTTQVQGVYFRAHTAEQAQRLGLVGWCRNTKAATVEGEVQGKAEQVATMKVSSGRLYDCIPVPVQLICLQPATRLGAMVCTPQPACSLQDWLRAVGSPGSRYALPDHVSVGIVGCMGWVSATYLDFIRVADA